MENRLFSIGSLGLTASCLCLLIWQTQSDWQSGTRDILSPLFLSAILLSLLVAAILLLTKGRPDSSTREMLPYRWLTVSAWSAYLALLIHPRVGRMRSRHRRKAMP
jgi:hypothetical protein